MLLKEGMSYFMNCTQFSNMKTTNFIAISYKIYAIVPLSKRQFEWRYHVVNVGKCGYNISWNSCILIIKGWKKSEFQLMPQMLFTILNLSSMNRRLYEWVVLYVMWNKIYLYLSVARDKTIQMNETVKKKTDDKAL